MDKAARLRVLSDIEEELDHLHDYLYHDEEPLAWASLDALEVLTTQLGEMVHHPSGSQAPPYA